MAVAGRGGSGRGDGGLIGVSPSLFFPGPHP